MGGFQKGFLQFAAGVLKMRIQKRELVELKLKNELSVENPFGIHSHPHFIESPENRMHKLQQRIRYNGKSHSL